MNIPFLDFSYINEIIKKDVLVSFEQFFDSKYYVLGERTRKFEEEYASYSSTRFAYGVSNGLDALHLCLRALDVGNGDEVIVPSNTYIASLLAISYAGATPVLVEPDIKTFNIDPDRIEKAITNRTKAIMPVHLYGQPCEMDKIMAIANKYELKVIEDNAQSQGAKYKDKITGSFGHLNAVSFYPSKNLGALGEAGAVTTDSEELAEKIRVLRNYGSEKRYYNQYKGFNNRIDELQAGFLSIKLAYLDDWNQQRRKIADWYYQRLGQIKTIQLPFIHSDSESVFHLFVIKSEDRDQLMDHLKSKGIGTLVHYPVPPHLQQAYKEFDSHKGDYPIAEKLSDTVLSLPLYPGIQENQIDYISESIMDFYK